MKKIIFYIVLIGASCILIYCIDLCSNESCKMLLAQDDNEVKKIQQITFSVDGGNMYFYDQSKKTIYIYSTQGQFRRAFVVDRLGLRLKTSKSSVIRQLIEDEK